MKRYPDEQVAAMTRRIVAHLRRSGPTARSDFPEALPDISDYMLMRCLQPLLRDGSVQRRTQRVTRPVRSEWGSSISLLTTVFEYKEGGKS